MTISSDQLKGMTQNGDVRTEGGDKVGGIGQVYLDDASGAPTWVTVKTGLFGTAESFVPLEGARQDGEDIIVAFDQATIKDAPRVEADGSITPEEEQQLFRHYGLSSPTTAAETTTTDRDSTDLTTAGRQPVDPATVGRANADATATATDADDDAMTVSEEQLRVSKQTQTAGRAVLRKYVVTEYVTQTVPVRREKVRLEHEPISEDELGSLVDSGVAFEDEVFEVILHQEVPVVQTQTVAVERVRMTKETVTDEVTVSDDVRKERVEVDDPTRTQSAS